MFNPRNVIIEHFVAQLAASYLRVFGAQHREYADLLRWAGTMALEKTSHGDALFHDMDHTIMVTSVGQEILIGKHLREGNVTPLDWLHMVISTLCIDLGYVRHLCQGDQEGRYATGVDGMTVQLPPGATGASLAPWRIDRTCHFIRQYFANYPAIDVTRLCANLRFTQFPVPEADPLYAETSSYPALTRAAYLIGAVADLHYMRKFNSLFLEYQENGIAAQLGCHSAVNFRSRYPDIYHHKVAPYLPHAICYLQETEEGNQWLANMSAHLHAEIHNEAALGIARARTIEGSAHV